MPCQVPIRRCETGDVKTWMGFSNGFSFQDIRRIVTEALHSYNGVCIIAGTVDSADQVGLPEKLAQLYLKLYEFRVKTQVAIPVSISRISCWNLNSWKPKDAEHKEKSKKIANVVRKMPILLQETKWSAEELQQAVHQYPGVQIATTLAEGRGNARMGGVAILLPVGWTLIRSVEVIPHYVVAALVEFRTYKVWLTSVYFRPEWTLAHLQLVKTKIEQLQPKNIMYIGGDFNRCDTKWPNEWQHFLDALQLEDAAPNLQTFHYGDNTSALDKFLIPTIHRTTTQTEIKVNAYPFFAQQGHALIQLKLMHRPRYRIHPGSIKHETIPTIAFLNPNAVHNNVGFNAWNNSLADLRRRCNRLSTSMKGSRNISLHAKATIWSWWREASTAVRWPRSHKRLYRKLLGRSDVVHISLKDAAALQVANPVSDISRDWPQQGGAYVVPKSTLRDILTTLEVHQSAANQLPFVQPPPDPVAQGNATRAMWDKLKAVCPKGSFYYGPIYNKENKEVSSAAEYDQAMLDTRNFWFEPPIRWDNQWGESLRKYQNLSTPWSQISPPSHADYLKQILNTKDSAPGPDGIPYAAWRYLPHVTTQLLEADMDRIIGDTAPPPVQVGVWIPKAKLGPTADFFRPLGMPDTLDRLQDGAAAAVLYQHTRDNFHPSQTMLNFLREPQIAANKIQGVLDDCPEVIALFLDLSKAFERINAWWLIEILYIKRASSWIIKLATRLLFGRQIRHKVQGRLLPPRAVLSGVDMGRSSSVFFFCLAMDPIFTLLNAIPRILAVEGYVDDTTLAGPVTPNFEWVIDTLRYLNSWKQAGIVMDKHTCWNLAIPTDPTIPLGTLLDLPEIENKVEYLLEEGMPTLFECFMRAPPCRDTIIICRGKKAIHLPPHEMLSLLANGSPLVGRLAREECTCRAKTTVVINCSLVHKAAWELDKAGIGLQCVEPTTINLGLMIRSGWTYDVSGELSYAMPDLQLTTVMHKQIAKFKARLNAAKWGTMSIRTRIIYFNSFCLSLFYYVQSWIHFPDHQLKLLYKLMSEFVLQRHWLPAQHLAGSVRWLKIRPLLDPALMQAVASLGFLHRRGLTISRIEEFGAPEEDPQAAQAYRTWNMLKQTLPTSAIRQLLAIENDASMPPHKMAKRFKQCLSKAYLADLQTRAVAHISQRIHKSGWPHGPNILFLEWLANLSTTKVGNIPRFTILRWALTEDSDVWLFERGKLTRTQNCCLCGRVGRKYPLGASYGATCSDCCPNFTNWSLLNVDEEEKNGYQFLFNKSIPEIPECLKPLQHLVEDNQREVNQAHTLPCVLCNTGSNSIGHWCQFCPVLQLTINALLPIENDWFLPRWDCKPPELPGILQVIVTFHMRRLIKEKGGLTPNLPDLDNSTPLVQNVLDIARRSYADIPSAFMLRVKCPPCSEEQKCLQTDKLKVLQTPKLDLDAAVLPNKGIQANVYIKRSDDVAILSSKDPRLGFLIMQQIKVPCPTVKVSLRPYVCQCGKTHVRMVAEEDICPGFFLTTGVQTNSDIIRSPPTLIVQFDGSCHATSKAGGAGIAALSVTAQEIELVSWKAVALPECTDNVIAEAQACKHAFMTAQRIIDACLAQQRLFADVYIQGDILPIINFLNNQNRIRTPEVVEILEICRNIMTRMSKTVPPSLLTKRMQQAC